jgi:hypothetical protein
MSGDNVMSWISTNHANPRLQHSTWDDHTVLLHSTSRRTANDIKINCHHRISCNHHTPKSKYHVTSCLEIMSCHELAQIMQILAHNLVPEMTILFCCTVLVVVGENLANLCQFMTFHYLQTWCHMILWFWGLLVATYPMMTVDYDVICSTTTSTLQQNSMVISCTML